MDASILAALSLGFLRGLQHALDPDHLVAVTTIVSEHKSIARSSLIGTIWGLGHTASLLAVGILVILLRVSVDERTALWLELPVALMLVALGVSALWRLKRDQEMRLHTHEHSHGDSPGHKHLHVHDGREHDHRHIFLRLGRRPFVIGMVHGVAGSAVLMLAVLTTIPSVAIGLIYIALFGLGSVGGMLLMSALIGLPFVATANRFSAINSGIRITAGIFSVLFGLMLGWELLTEIGKVR